MSRSTKLRRRTLQRRFRIGPTIGKLMAVLALAVLGVVALTQSAGREADVYKLTDLRSQQGEVEQEIADLKMLEARAKTLDKIAQSQVKQEMVPVGDAVQQLSTDQSVAGATTQR
jgi:Tfp pilus assembly protein PilN